jgi:hypothetical protein
MPASHLPDIKSLSCRIAPTTSSLHGRNSVVEFELTTKIDRIFHPTTSQRQRDEKTGRLAA